MGFTICYFLKLRHILMVYKSQKFTFLLLF